MADLRPTSPVVRTAHRVITPYRSDVSINPRDEFLRKTQTIAILRRSVPVQSGIDGRHGMLSSRGVASLLVGWPS
jgi:hypothetical protein